MKVSRLIALVLFNLLIFFIIDTIFNSVLGTREALISSILASSIPGITLYMRLYHPVQLYSFALNFFPRSAMLYNNRGTAYMRREDYELGLKDLTHAIELKPNFTLAYYNRGSTYQRMRKFQQAIEDFTVALQLRPKWLFLYHNRGTTYVQKRDYQRAIQDYSRILTSQPRYVASLLGRAIAYGRLKVFEHALQDCEAASKLLPHSIATYGVRGTIHLLAHDYQRAISDYDKALTYRHGGTYKADVYIGRSLVYTRLKNYQQALQESNEVLALAPQRADAYNVRGLAYLGLKELRQAQSDFARACELFPESCPFRLLLVWTELCTTGPNAEHAERLLAAAQTDSFHHAAPICRGVAFWLRTQFADAAQAIEPAIASSPDEWETAFWIGLISASQGFDEEAIRALRNSITQGLPPALLTPLTTLKQQRPDFYEQYATELLGG